MNDLSAPKGSTELALMTGIEDNRAAVEALAELLTTTMESGGSELTHLGMGVHVLFRFITDHAARNMAVARDLLQDRRETAGKLDPAHPDYQATIASNDRLVAEMHALRADKEAMRRELLAETVDAGQIAEAANVEPDAVQRVIAQLVAMSAPQAPATGKRASR